MSRNFAVPEQRTLDELYTVPDENILVRCRVCRRVLRDKRRRAAGIGRVCERKEVTC